MLAASLAFAAFQLTVLFLEYSRSRGYISGPFQPFGWDYINLWSSGRMIAEGLVEQIYSPVAFEAYQIAFVQADTGLRIWAYPPHSLFLSWPFGQFGFFAGFLAWSLLGVGVLAAGAAYFGFNRFEILLLILSPAAIINIYYGQSGNLAGGLMLAALAGGSHQRNWPIAAAALLTLKPQTGFLLPLLWLRNRQWILIVSTTAAVLALVGLSVAVFGVETWRDYLGETLPRLSRLEREGEGPFLFMIPSVFISMRLLGFDGATSFTVHLIFAAAIAGAMVWRLWREPDRGRQAAILLIGTCLVTPYMHVYDLSILMAGAIILARGDSADARAAKLALVMAWGLPLVLSTLSKAGLPVAPLVMLLIFLLACRDKEAPALRPDLARAAG